MNKFLTLVLLIQISCSVSEGLFGSLPNKDNNYLALANFFSRYKKKCTISPTKFSTTNQTTNEVNNYNCKFDYSSISNYCSYSVPIEEIGVSTNSKRTYYNSVGDLFRQKEIFGKYFQTFEIFNEDKNLKKQSYYQNDSLSKLLESNGNESTITTNDSKGRPLTGYLIFHCEVPFTYEYNEQNLSFNLKVLFSQTVPNSNSVCVFYRNFQIFEYSYEFDSNLILKKLTTNIDGTQTILSTTISETEEVCIEERVGNSFSEKFEPAEVSSIQIETTAAVGNFINLIGKNFNSNFSQNKIKFLNSNEVTPVSGNSNSLRVQIPTGSNSGRILIDNGKAKSYSPTLIIP